MQHNGDGSLKSYSLQCLQKPTTCPYPEPDKSISCPSFYFFIALLILFSNLCIYLPSILFHSGFTPKSLHVLLFFLMCATSSAQLTLLYLMNLTLFGWGTQIRKPPPPSPTSFSIFLLNPSSLAQISSLAPFLEKKSQPFSSLNPLNTKINVHCMWVWLLITSLIWKGTLIISRVRFHSLGTTAFEGPTVAGMNQNEYRALSKL